MQTESRQMSNTVEVFRTLCGYVPRVETLTGVLKIWRDHKASSESPMIFLFGEKRHGAAPIWGTSRDKLVAEVKDNGLSDRGLLFAMLFQIHEGYLKALDVESQILICNERGDAVVLDIKRCAIDLFAFWHGGKSRGKGFKK